LYLDPPLTRLPSLSQSSLRAASFVRASGDSAGTVIEMESIAGAILAAFLSPPRRFLDIRRMSRATKTRKRQPPTLQPIIRARGKEASHCAHVRTHKILTRGMNRASIDPDTIVLVTSETPSASASALRAPVRSARRVFEEERRNSALSIALMSSFPSGPLGTKRTKARVPLVDVSFARIRAPAEPRRSLEFA
jgi:hypothetical protein